MEVLNDADAAFRRLHEAGWSIGDTASVGASGTVWIVFGTKGGPVTRTEGATRADAWQLAVD